jgi:hypothetical protein
MIEGIQMPDEKKAQEANFIALDEEIPFAVSPFDEERRPPEINLSKTVLHQTVGGKGVVGRLRGK